MSGTVSSFFRKVYLIGQRNVYSRCSVTGLHVDSLYMAIYP